MMERPRLPPDSPGVPPPNWLAIVELLIRFVRLVKRLAEEYDGIVGREVPAELGELLHELIALRDLLDE